MKQKGKSLQKRSKTCVKKHFIISPSHIHLLRFTIEAYEGIGVVTTIDAGLGLIELSIAPGCEEDVAEILRSESERLQLRPVNCQGGPFAGRDRAEPDGPEGERFTNGK